MLSFCTVIKDTWTVRTGVRIVSVLVISRIIDCKTLCRVGMCIAVGWIFVENTVEAIVENVCAVTVVCTGFKSFRMLS